MGLLDKLDEALFGEIEQENSQINESDFLKNFLGLFPNKSPKSSPKSIQSDELEPVTTIEPNHDPEPVEKTKSGKAPTQHIKSYAVARGKGFLRVAVEGDKSLTKARLHIFKKGNRYFGFLVVPGPGGKTRNEWFEYNVALMLESNIYESVSDVVLKFDSDDLGELFDLSKYADRSNLPVDKFKQYESEVGVLDLDAAEKAEIGRLPWGKQQRDTLRQEDPVDIDIELLRKLSEKYLEMAERERDEVIKFLYEFMGEAASKITNKEQIQTVINNIKEAIDNNRKKGDTRSLKKADVYEVVLSDFISAIEDLEI